LAGNFNEPGSWSNGDFDCDGAPRFSDFVILADHFGEPAAGAAMQPVPEPSTWIQGLAGLVLLCCRGARQHDSVNRRQRRKQSFVLCSFRVPSVQNRTAKGVGSLFRLGVFPLVFIDGRKRLPTPFAPSLESEMPMLAYRQELE
jgi:hypothetical protein